jgi:rhodanese-related sulfurtransferase
MSMQEAMEARKQDPNILLIDVRTPAEYRGGHIPGSISLPLDAWERIGEVASDKHTPIFVYCLSGARSQAACRGFLGLGYDNVTNIGGISAYEGPLEK